MDGGNRAEAARNAIGRYLRFLQRQCMHTLKGDYGLGATRYLRWAADDVERFTPEELLALIEDQGGHHGPWSIFGADKTNVERKT
jgi:hypothetical protein